MSNIVISKRGKRHVIFSVVGFSLFSYMVYGFYLSISKDKFDSTIFVLIVAGILMLAFSLVHAFIGFLMIFRYKPMMDDIQSKRVLKVLNYEDEPRKLIVVKCGGRMMITSQR